MLEHREWRAVHKSRRLRGRNVLEIGIFAAFILIGRKCRRHGHVSFRFHRDLTSASRPVGLFPFAKPDVAAAASHSSPFPDEFRDLERPSLTPACFGSEKLRCNLVWGGVGGCAPTGGSTELCNAKKKLTKKPILGYQAPAEWKH